VWIALPALLRDREAELTEIGTLLALLILPWTLKFLWAPLVDVLRSSRWGFRHWITMAQLAMGACLLPLIWLDPEVDRRLWMVVLLAHAFCAATQDVAIDALAVRTVTSGERGVISGWMQAGMLLGRSLFGGGALLLFHQVGWAGTILLLIACIWLSLPLVWQVAEPPLPPSPRERVRAFRAALEHVAARRGSWFGIGFALTGGAAFEAAGLFAGPYLLDHGLAMEQVGWFLGVPAVAAMVIGGLTGGKLADRFGKRRMTGLFLVALAGLVTSLGFTGDPGRGAATGLVLGLFGATYFAIGLFVASSYALFMNLTDPRLGGTQFSLFMGATNACEAWSGWAGGQLGTAGGYPLALPVMSLISLVGLGLLWAMRDRAIEPSASQKSG
jgi:MFS transporter, PAT family, beta-lactamase induction signal transducer AmpG